MLTPEIQNYINQARAQGISDEQIRQNLVAQGWKETELNQLIKSNELISSSFSLERVVRILLAVINTFVLIVACYVALVEIRQLFFVLPLIFGVVLTWVAIARKSTKMLLILIGTEILFGLMAFTLFWSLI